MRQVTHTEKKAFLVVLGFFGAAFLFLMRPLLVPFLLATILVILLYPTYRFFLGLFRQRPYIASFVTTFLIFLTLVLPFGLIIALLADQTIAFVSQLNVQEAFTFFRSGPFYQEYLMPLIHSFEEGLRLKIDLEALATRAGTEMVKYVYDFSPQVLGRTATFVFGFFIMHVSIYFLFIEGKNLFKMLVDISPLKGSHEELLTLEFKNMIYATVYGYLLTALVQALLAWIGFQIAGVNAPLVFATLTFFMSLVPIFGATSVWLPISIWFLLQGQTGWALFLGVYGAFVISGIDNIIKPLIMRGKAKIHILLIFFSLLGGLSLFGPLGILFGPVITALFVACLRLYREDFLKRTV